jgi:hypothetical protein
MAVKVGKHSGTKKSNTTHNTEDKRKKIEALSLAKECYSMKLDLLANATVVDDAIRFVSQKSEEKLKSASSNRDKSRKVSEESDYDEDQDQLEGEEEETGETSEAAINEVF